MLLAHCQRPEENGKTHAGLRAQRPAELAQNLPVPTQVELLAAWKANLVPSEPFTVQDALADVAAQRALAAAEFLGGLSKPATHMSRL